MNANFIKFLLVLTAFAIEAIGSYVDTKLVRTLETARFKTDHLLLNDIPIVANLVSSAFSGPFQWWQKAEQFYALKTAEIQLESRYKNLVCGGLHHAMIVVRDVEANNPVGFIEIGMMPAPSIAEFKMNSDKRPVIGNLVVDNSFRRQGLGSMLMLRAIEEAKTWNQLEVRCAVEVNNDVAKQLYIDRLGFEVLGIERAKFLDSMGDRIHLKKTLDFQETSPNDNISLEDLSIF